jgi:hypothetical protein
MLESPCSTEQHSLEFLYSFWGAIRQCALRLGPYKFHRIKLRGISRKPFQMESWIAIEEVTDRLPLVDKGFVPQEDDMTSEVLQEMAQKDRHIRGLNILPLKSEVKRQVPLFRRDGKSGNGRNPLSPIEMMQDRGLSLRRPRSAHIGDEQKPTLIEKGQMGSKYGSFFLLLANVSSSSLLSPPRPFREPAVLASDNSILALSEVARGDWDDSEFQRPFELLRPPVSWSKGRCCNQKPKDPLAKGSLTVSSPALKVWRDDPERPCNSALSLLPFERPVAIEKRNLRRNLLVEPRPTRSCPSLATGSLVGAASPVASGFLKVSWLLLYHRIKLFSIIYA